MASRRAQQVVIAQRLRLEGGGGEGLSIAAIAREMGISTSYAGELLVDPTGEKGRERRRRQRGSKPRVVWTREMVIEAIKDWEIQFGRPPAAHEWQLKSRLPDWAPTTNIVYRLFGKGGWNKAIEAAGFTPRPAHAPEWVQNTPSSRVTPMRPEVREAMSVERKALYAENPDHPMFTGLREGWDKKLERQERRDRRFLAKQVVRRKPDS
jgi:hypothetical protein